MTRSGLLGLAVTVVAVGCMQPEQESGQNSEDNQSVASRSDTLFYQHHTSLWRGEKGVVPVCFVDSTLSADWQFVKAKLDSTWGSAGDLTFTGFSLCPATGSFVRIRLVQSTGTGGGQTLGLGTDAIRRTNTWSVSIDKPANNLPYYEYLIVHEFGHVLGFPHEYDRADSTLTTCTGYAAGEFSTGFDPESIMTSLYCNRPLRTDLSSGDKQGVATVYGAPRLTHPCAT